MRKKIVKDCTFSSFNSYNENGAPLNLSQEELAVSKLDKGNCIAIIDKSNYLKKLQNILSDSSKFT